MQILNVITTWCTRGCALKYIYVPTLLLTVGCAEIEGNDLDAQISPDATVTQLIPSSVPVSVEPRSVVDAPKEMQLSQTSGGPIYVNLAFDGSSSLNVWQDTLDFAAQHDVKFTFFIVGVHLLKDDLAPLYDPPRRRKGRSDVGFGGTQDDVATRLAMIRRAYQDGHEIGGHANGHWDGSEFTYEEWRSELEQFQHFVANAYELNGIQDPNPTEWASVAQSVVSFRAPLLAYNAPMYRALADTGYRYDTSQVQSVTVDPNFAQFGVRIFPLSPIKTTRGRTITMDYNFFVLNQGRPDGAGAHMLASYKKHFAHAKERGVTRVQYGHHFSRWHGGQYWWALKEFIKAVCDTGYGQCVTISDASSRPEQTATVSTADAQLRPG